MRTALIATLYNEADNVSRWWDCLMRQTVLPKSGSDKPGPLFMTIRIAITGKTATPGLFETMVALGQETVIRRLETALKEL